MQSASSGAFNTRHLKRCLESRGGHFAEMGEDELQVVSAQAEQHLGKRDRKVVILDDRNPARTFNVSKSFKGLAHIFEDARPKKDEPGYAQMNSYKLDELTGLVASLDKMLTTSTRSGLVLCQTTQHVRKCLIHLANAKTGLVTQKDTTGELFVINPKALPSYREFGVTDEITVVLYSATRFRKRDRSKTGAVDKDDDRGQFSSDLESALDISRNKLLLWTAYKSASRGINFLTRQHGVQRDFELFCLLNDPYYISFFHQRVKLVRAEIAKNPSLEANAALKLSFTMSSKDAWYLGPRPKLDIQSMLNAVAGSPGKFIELMLLKELIESSALDAEDTFVCGGFGPGVYLGSANQASKKYLQLAQAEYAVNAKHSILLCDVTAKRFSCKVTAKAESAATTRLASAGEGFLVGVTRIVPDEFHGQDGRKFPMVGLSFDIDKIRRTRFYYLNLLIEFAMRLFTRAGVPFARETFSATHCVDDAYIPLDPLANLQRPLVVVNATQEPLGHDALTPLVRFPEYLPGHHVAGGKKMHFAAPDVRTVSAVPEQLEPSLNYLFLNGEGDEDLGSVRLAKADSNDFQPAKATAAYTALAKGEGKADPYTTVKYHHLLARNTFFALMQGLNYGPQALAALRPGKKTDDGKVRQLQEALKRCLVELLLKCQQRMQIDTGVLRQ